MYPGQIDTSQERSVTHTHTHLPILAFASIASSTSRDLGASLPLPLKLVPLTTGTLVQDNTVLPPPAGRTASLAVTRINPVLLCYLLHQPSRDWDTQHHY